jgi:hypothetical protein
MSDGKGLTSPSRPWFEAGCALLLFGLLSCLYFYPVFTRFSTAIIGPAEDNTQFIWFLWYGSKALFDPALDFFHTRMIYYPDGMGLWYANYFYVGVIMTAALKPLVGLAASYNLTVLFSFAASGASAYALVRYLTRDRIAAVCSGFVYAFNPLHFAHALHHPSVASMQFIPLFVLFLIKAHRDGRQRDRLAAGAMLALSAYCEWNYLIYGGLCLAMSYPWTAWSQRRVWSMRGFMNLMIIGGAAFLLTAPVLVPMVLIGLQHPESVYLPGHNIFVADLLGFFVPHAFHPLGGLPWVKSIAGSMTGPVWEQAVYLGWMNLLLVAVALFKIGRRSFPYLAAFLFFAVLALGVELHVRGLLTGISLPYALFESLPLLKHARNPSRTMAFGYLFWAVLTGLAVQRLFRSPSAKLKHRLGLVIVAALGFMDFYSLASEITPVELPPVYGAILKDPGYAKKEFAIMNLPWDKGRLMMEQTIHGLPDLQGYLGRKFSIPLIGKLPFDDLAAQKRILIQNKVKYILMRKKRMSWNPSVPEELRIYGGITQLSRGYARVYEKIYEDDRDALFKVY